jgi:glycosyltransferase involved in cell wall biosynthesis
MRLLFALPGLHRYNRGAEVAFISVARELAAAGESVTLIGSGDNDNTTLYRFVRAHSLRRENFELLPSMPVLRNEYVYEEMTFAPSLLLRYRPADYDVTVTCSYPFTNWVLRRRCMRGARPPHVFVTQNGDYAASCNTSEYRLFGCEGLVCTNPDYYERNKQRWRCKLIPNGVDCSRFCPGTPTRQEFKLPEDKLVILMVSALIPSKRVGLGIEAVAKIANAHLVVAGDGPMRNEIQAKGEKLLSDRFSCLSVPPQRMPDLYRSANILLHLSKEESFGNALLEAMACGLPIVAHDSPRARWIVGNEESLLDTADADAVAKHIHLASKTLPEQEQRRVNRAANFSWQKISLMYRDFLQEVIAASSAAAENLVHD